jgi:hypothetical protein
MWLVNLPNQLCIIALVGRNRYQQALKHRLPIRERLTFNLAFARVLIYVFQALLLDVIGHAHPFAATNKNSSLDSHV